MLLFEQAGLETDAFGVPTCLVFIGDPELEILVAGGEQTGGSYLSKALKRIEPRLILTDHNKVQREAEWFKLASPPVLKILDHHSKEYTAQEMAGAEITLDEGVASACTLAAEQFLQFGVPIPPEMQTLLLGTILTDTRNFDENENRFNQRDIDVYEQLVHNYTGNQAWVAGNGPGKWFNDLKIARKDVQNLTVS